MSAKIPDVTLLGNLSTRSISMENISMASAQTMDGVVTDSASIAYYTRRQTQPSRHTVDGWLENVGRQEELLKRILDPVLDLISEDHQIADELIDGDNLRKDLTEVIQRSREEVAAFQDMQTELQVPVRMIPFSRVKQPVLDEIGVEEYDGTNLFTEAKRAWLADSGSGTRPFNASYQEYWLLHGGYDQYQCFVSLSAKSIPQTFEAASRTIIDNVFMGVSDLLKRYKPTQRLIQVPEMKVQSRPAADASMPSGAFPVYTKDMNGAIVFTGSVDYGMAIRERKAEATSEILDKLQSANNAAEVLFMHNLRVLVVEAKRRQDPESLKNHAPQVIAEAIASITVWCKMRMRLSELRQQTLAQPWCLTDGTEWVFGVVMFIGRQNKWFNIRLAKARNDCVFQVLTDMLKMDIHGKNNGWNVLMTKLRDHTSNWKTWN